jgi:phage tail sheath protein FI
LQLHENGALAGATPEDSFYIKCDVETNPPASRDLGRLVTEIGLAPGVPSEFIVVRIVQDASGATIATQASS